MPTVKVAFVGQIRPAIQVSTNGGTFKGKIEFKKYSKEEYELMLMAEHQQLCQLQKKAGLIKDTKDPRKQKSFRG